MGQKCTSDDPIVRCDRHKACTYGAYNDDPVYMTCGSSHPPSRDPELQARGGSRRLWEASVAGDVETIRDAIEAGIDIEARQSRSNGIRMQVKTTSRFFQEDDRVVHQTLSNEPEETVEFVGGVFHRLQGVERDRSSGQTPLMLAARASRPQAVVALLELRGSPYLKDELGMQPLHYAASAGCRECCKALLHARASPAVLDSSGRDAFACLPRTSIADQFDRVQWAALLAVPVHTGWLPEDFVSPPVLVESSNEWATLGTVFENQQDVDGSAPEPECVPMTGLRQFSDVKAAPSPRHRRTQVRVH
mmetsp:Transcript_67742/g.107319  ORF Transcript_67742/g.107319 Transcript_67742/m.107319 type:complete len:305 (+) Transcript_67742:79-993(+)